MSEQDKSTPVLSIGSTQATQENARVSTTRTHEDSPSQIYTEQAPIDLYDEEEDSGQGKKRKLTSSVWEHFKKQKVDGVYKAICNYCHKKLGGESKNGTKHLHEHLKRCPLRNQQDIRQTILNHKIEASGKVSMGTYAFDQAHARKELGHMIILHEYPLSMVEHIGFRRFVNAIQPLFKVVSRNTIKNDILQIYDYERLKVMRLLERNNSRIAITTDMWTSNQKKGFMAITAHFVDDYWRLQSRIMRFIYMPCPHTSESLSIALMDCLLDWNVDGKLSTLTVDNCTTNDAMINILLDKLSGCSLMLNGEFFHMRCCAHILNLIVKDGLEIIQSSVDKIRDSIAYWSATPKRVEKFEMSARQLKIPCVKKLALDCKTRWNSTYLMLQTALEYKNVFPRLKQRETQYRCLPSDEDWDLAKEICDRLEVFFEITELFSGTKYPTANLYFPNICEIKLSIYEWMTSPYVEIKLMASSMIEKFDKYWSKIHGILGVATVLDPRFKLKLVEYYFPMIYGNEAADHEIQNVRRLCQNLLNEYTTGHRSSRNMAQSSASSSQSQISTSANKRDRLAQFDVFVTTSTSTDSAKSELDIFLDEPVLPRSNDFDILAWWRANATKYPTLQKIARDILAIPVSTVASESAFSTSGRFVSPHRNRLHPKTLEALMCAQDWLWSEIHEHSSHSSYSGCCTKLCDTDIDEEEESSIQAASTDILEEDEI